MTARFSRNERNRCEMRTVREARVRVVRRNARYTTLTRPSATLSRRERALTFYSVTVIASLIHTLIDRAYGGSL